MIRTRYVMRERPRPDGMFLSVRMHRVIGCAYEYGWSGIRPGLACVTDLTRGPVLALAGAGSRSPWMVARSARSVADSYLV